MKIKLSKAESVLIVSILMFVLLTGNAYAAPLVVNAGVVVNTNTCDQISWTDSSGLARTASVVKINGNPSGYNGGYFSQVTYMDGATPVVCNESGAAGDLSGLGFMVNHQPTGFAGRGWANSKQDGFNGTTRIVFQGANHIIYETEMNEYADNGNIAKGYWKVKWQYMIRTGNDYIVDSISYDFSSQPYGTFGNDIRSPYCEMNWTGTGTSNTLSENIDGVEFCAMDNAATPASWIFKTVGSSPFTGGYTYNTPGRNIPYTLQWKNAPDREAGYVSTLDLTQWAAGGGYLSGPVNIGSTGASMPPNWAINYQSNGFQNWVGDKMTWGLPYGAAGGETAVESGSTTKSTFPDWTWRKNWNAYPYVGFTLLINIGKATANNTRALMNEEADIHSLPAGALVAANGTVVTTGKQSLYDASTFTFKPAGYNHMYRAWEVACNADQADVTLAPGAVSLKNQTFIFDNYNPASVPAVTVNGISLNDGVDMFASVDTVNKQLYVTFNQAFTGSVHIVMGGPANTPTFTNTVPAGSTNTFTYTATPSFTPTNTPNTSSCLFDNMENAGAPGPNAYGGFWYVYTGGTPAAIWPAVGGNLTPSAGGANSTAYANRITGYVGIAGTTYPCIGMGSQLNATAGSPGFTETDISSCTGIKFWVKGDGNSYLMKIPYTDAAGANLTGYNDYKVTFTAPAAWSQIDAPFASFAQAGGWGTTALISDVLKHAKEFQWQTNFNAAAGTATADLWVDEVTMYGCSSCPGGPMPTATYTNTFTSTPTYTPTNTVPPGSTNTFTPTATATFPGGTDCVNYQIDYSAVPSMVFMKKLTLKAMIGTCASASVLVDGNLAASTYDSGTGIITFNAQGTNIVITRNNYTGGATYAMTKATLYNDKKWAYSFTFDDGRPTTRTVVLPLFQTYGYVGGSALNTQNMTAGSDGYVMSWASADILRAAGWSFFDHNYSHLAVTCANISTETIPDQNSINARWPGYACTHFVYPYCDTTNWTCIRDSGLFLSAEDNVGNNYADVLPPNPFILNRGGLMAAGNLPTSAAANALADNAAADARPRWVINFAHEVVAGSGTPTTTYDTNEATLSAHISYIYNTYGEGGNKTMWFAPTDEVMQYILTREKAAVNFIGSGVCGNITPVTATNTYTPSNTPIVSPTSSAVCSFDNMEDADANNNYGGYWYTYLGGTPATVWPVTGQMLTPSAGGANSTAYAMRITGTVGIAGTTYPCIGMGSQLSATSGGPTYSEVDISSCTGIRFWVKGDGNSYLMKIPYTSSAGATLTGYNDYLVTFTAPATWSQVSAPFAGFSQASGWGTTADLSTVLHHAKEFQWQTNFNAASGTTTANLWVDEIVIYGCASCPGIPTVVPTSTNTPPAGSTNTFTPTATFTATCTYTNTNTPPPGATNTFTATPTYTAGLPTITNTPNGGGCSFDDMEDMNAANNYGGFWYTYLGGTPATVWPASGDTLTPSAGGANSTAYAMRITGTVGIAGSTYPCIGMGSQLNATAGSPNFTETNISSCTGIRFWVKGDGNSYLLKIPYTDPSGNNLTGFNDYKVTFTAPAAWSQVDAPFAAFAQAAGWGTSAVISTVLQHAKEFQWQTNFNAAAGTVTADLWIDEIVIYGCASCPAAPTAYPTATNTVPAATNTFTPTATYTVTNTPPPGSTSTYTFTASNTPTNTFTDTPTQTYTFTAVPTVPNPSLSTGINAPTDVTVGQQLTVIMNVNNNGNATVNNIAPSVLTVNGSTAAVTLLSGPQPAIVGSLAVNGNTAFTWLYDVTQSGSITFQGTASGNSGGPVNSPSSMSMSVTLHAAPTPTFTDTFTFSPTPIVTLTFTATSTPTPGNIIAFVTATPVLLYPNPNPVPGTTPGRTIGFTITKPIIKTVFKVYTGMGRLVRKAESTLPQPQGKCALDVDGVYFQGLAKGIYYYVVVVTDQTGKEAKSPIEKVVIQ